jgi:hypothetical protein
MTDIYAEALAALERAGLLTVTETADGDLLITPTPKLLRRFEGLTPDDAPAASPENPTP